MTPPEIIPMKDFLLRSVSRYPEIQRIVLFGSRARGDALERSDFDVAIQAPGMPHERWARFVVEVQENVPSLCGIDLVLLSERTSPSLKETIEKEGITLYSHAA